MISKRKKSLQKSLNSSSINNTEINWTNSLDSFFNSSNNKVQENELDLIIKLMINESELNITRFDTILFFYIRKNPKIKNDIIEKIINTLNNNDNIYYKSIIKCINTILDLLTENFQIINLLNNTIPIILNCLYQEENIKSLDAIHEICIFIGKLIKIGDTHISGLIEEIVETIFFDIFKENPNDCNIYYAYIHLLSEIMYNSTMASFNSVIIKNGIENFIKLFGICFKNKNEIIRQMAGELTSSFIKMLMNRDNETKKSYVSILYYNILGQYDFNVKINDFFPNNYIIVSSFFLNLKKIYLSYPIFFNEESIYQNLVDNIMKCTNCGKKEENIKIEFIKFIPDLYQMNKRIFKKQYLKDILEYAKGVLTREQSIEIKNNLLLTLSTLNFYEYDLINQICSNSIISVIKNILSDKNCPNDKVLKSLANFLNNKKCSLSQYVIQIIDIFTLLPKIFKTPLNNFKIDFLISLINYYSYCSIENIAVIILCLNTVSLIICNEEIKLDNFMMFNDESKISLISDKLPNLKINLIKDVNKYMSDNNSKDKNNPKYYQMISNALTLFSNIKNNLFYKDMFIFYNNSLLPLLKYFQNEINKQIISIILCDFVTIYKDDENLSEFIIKNIIDSIINIFILGKDNLFEDELIKIFENKKIIIEIILKENIFFYQKLFNILETSINSKSKELLTRIISILEKNDNNKGTYIRFIGNYIETLIFEIYNSQSNIFEEDSINFLLYLTSYFKHIFTKEVYEKVLNISILIIINHYELKDILIINALNIIHELLTLENNDINKISNIYNVLYILSLNLLKGSNINDYLSEIVLKLFYKIIQLGNIDIYSENIFIVDNLNLIDYTNLNLYGIHIKESIEKLISINKTLENINIIELLFNHLIKGENINNCQIIMKILGLCQAKSPKELEKFYFLQNTNNQDENDEQYILEDDELQINRFNKITKRRITLNYSFIEPSNTKAILTLMEILKYYTQKDLKIKIILNLQLLIQSIPPNQSYFIDIILPTIINIIPLYECKYQIVLFKDISLIITNFKEKSRIYLDDIVILINNYIKDNYLESIYQLFLLLFEYYEYEMAKYYHQLIPKFLKIIKSDAKENISYIKLLILITKSSFIYPYMKLILAEIETIFLRNNEIKIINSLMDLLKQIMSYPDTYIFFPTIILIFRTYYQNENKLKSIIKNSSNSDLNIVIFNKFLDILKLMNDKYRSYFMIFLPKIIKIFTSSGIIEYGNFRQKLKKIVNSGNNFTFMHSNNYLKRASIRYCKINCHLGFNSLTDNKNENKKEIKELNNEFEDFYKSIDNMDIENNNYYRSKKPRGSFAKKKLNNVLVKTRRGFVNNEIVVRAFDNGNCRLEKDWNEWYKISRKSLFEQSPSNFIYISYLNIYIII